MLASLGIGINTFTGPQIAPAGDRSSFLSLTSAPAPLASSSLSTLLEARKVHRRNLSNGCGHLSFDLRHISRGRFTEETIANMHKAVLSAKTDARWRQLMENIRQEGRARGAIKWKDYLGEVNWFDHFYRNIHFIDYVRDPGQVELVMHPWHTYHKQLGDCDDSSTLWAASLGALGAAHRFRTYRADPARPDEWSHVVAQLYVPGHGWINNDLTIRGAFPGFEPLGYPHKDWPEPRW